MLGATVHAYLLVEHRHREPQITYKSRVIVVIRQRKRACAQLASVTAQDEDDGTPCDAQSRHEIGQIPVGEVLVIIVLDPDQPDLELVEAARP
jgi:hypothetical protein